jgi:hypothetical protein
MLLWNQASVDPIRAAEALIKLEAREARLLGLDMPTKVSMTDPDGGIPLRVGNGGTELRKEVSREEANGMYAHRHCRPNRVLGGRQRRGGRPKPGAASADGRVGADRSGGRR